MTRFLDFTTAGAYYKESWSIPDFITITTTVHLVAGTIITLDNVRYEVVYDTMAGQAVKALRLHRNQVQQPRNRAERRAKR